jgi:8-oxo-dGTP diphosphatase
MRHSEQPPIRHSLWVAAGVVIEERKVLLSQRRSGTHLAGAWEFPGGKVEPGEDPRETARRELREELGIEVVVGEILDVAYHVYGDKAITLMFFNATRTAESEAPRALEVADVRWTPLHELQQLEFPPADAAVLRKVISILEASP